MTSTKYIGVDVPKESISICVRNSVGKVVMECVVETRASTILQFIEGLRGDLRVSFEEGTWAAFVIVDPRDDAINIWSYDVSRRLKARLTFEPIIGYFPTWSPNGDRLFFAPNRLGQAQVFSVSSSGVAAVERKWFAYPSNESGRTEVYIIPFPAADRKTPLSTGITSGARCSLRFTPCALRPTLGAMDLC